MNNNYTYDYHCACDSSSSSSSSSCNKRCYLSGNKNTFYNNCTPLNNICNSFKEDSSSKNDSIYIENNNSSLIQQNYKDCYLKIMLKGRIGSFHSFIIDNNNIHTFKNIGSYKILQVNNGYLIFYIKEINNNIDFNYYINMFNNPMEIIFIKNGLIDKLIEEELDLKMYIQTLLKDDFTQYYANIHVMKKNNYISMLSNINPIDALFYSSQAYFLFKK